MSVFPGGRRNFLHAHQCTCQCHHSFMPARSCQALVLGHQSGVGIPGHFLGVLVHWDQGMFSAYIGRPVPPVGNRRPPGIPRACCNICFPGRVRELLAHVPDHAPISTFLGAGRIFFFSFFFFSRHWPQYISNRLAFAGILLCSFVHLRQCIL